MMMLCNAGASKVTSCNVLIAAMYVLIDVNCVHSVESPSIEAEVCHVGICSGW